MLMTTEDDWDPWGCVIKKIIEKNDNNNDNDNNDDKTSTVFFDRNTRDV
jgi:hypothetical protein